MTERANELRDLAETPAVLSAVYGMSIGSNPISGMTLGPKAERAIARALELDPDNPRVWLIHGISALYTPPAFGGGIDKALARFDKSRELFETDAPQPPKPAWGKAEIHVWLGIAHLQKGDRAAAEREFRRALEPDFAWVKENLLPQLAESS